MYTYISAAKRILKSIGINSSYLPLFYFTKINYTNSKTDFNKKRNTWIFQEYFLKVNNFYLEIDFY